MEWWPKVLIKGILNVTDTNSNCQLLVKLFYKVFTQAV